MVFAFLRRAFWPARTVVSIPTNSHTRPLAADSHPSNHHLHSHHLEALESRTLFTVATPTAEEQFMLELINRARTAPASEAYRFRIALNEGLPANTLSGDKRQPLAFNTNLISAARTHSQWMINSKAFSHTGANGSNPQTRMSGAGYAFVAGLSGWAENLGWAGRRLVTPITADMVDEVHRRLFVDADVSGRGHRVNMLNSKMKEVGIGVATGVVSGFKAVMTTADFAWSGSNAFLTGVAYQDTVKVNKFYNVGEGIGGIVVSAKRVSDGKLFTATTWSSGGYTLALAPGTYAVSASGGLAAHTQAVTINSNNVKLDFLPTGQLDNTAPIAKLTITRRLLSPKIRTIEISYKDETLVDASSIGKGDIFITNSKGFRRSARLISLTPNGDASSIRAVYRVNGPRNGWGKGRYNVMLVTKAVTDTFGNFTKAKKLGSFAVK